MNGPELGGLASPAEGSLAAEPFHLLLHGAPLTCSGVQIGPGAAALTRMPLEASCFSSDFSRRLTGQRALEIEREEFLRPADPT
jgi:hypothetical protein